MLYTVARRSPKNAAALPLPAPAAAIVTAARTPPSALNVQCSQPSFRPSEYTRPDALPTNTRSPTIVGLAAAWFSPSNPYAHLSFRFAVCAAVIPGCFWYRSLLSDTPQDCQSAAPGRTAGAAAVAAPAPPASHFRTSAGVVG